MISCYDASNRRDKNINAVEIVVEVVTGMPIVELQLARQIGPPREEKLCERGREERERES